MDTTESEQQEALRVWALALEFDDPFIRGLRDMVWDRYKLYNDKASEKELQPMSLVIGTVGTIDPNSICADPDCDQVGEPLKDHRVTHKNRAGPRGARGLCPHCQGKMHNTNDAAQLIAFQCLWKQAFGEDARKVPVTLATLATVVSQITGGTITVWADRALTHTATLARPASITVIPVGGTHPVPLAPSAPAVVAVVASPPPAHAAPVAAPVSPPAPAPAVGEIAAPPRMTEAQLEARRKKIKAAMADAKVIP